MPSHHGFERIREQEIPEIKTRAELYRHGRTGAELLSLINEDENKVFGITFRTPPEDSTGVAHILEHAVLCGSRKYPVKEPFVELLKGSLQTFLNAMTYPDKTCYPVASQNSKDFYNLIDVYLDAVFYPRINPEIFMQEGWHYELEKVGDPLNYKGVVFNEMKGAHSSPDNLLYEFSRQSLFPDNPYGLESGGDPALIPNLTFDRFSAFHRKHYHPSNCRIFFYGDDDPKHRLDLIHEYLKDFEWMAVDSNIPLQRPFYRPGRMTRPFPAGEDESGTVKGMVTVNWLLAETIHREVNVAFQILEYILLGMPGSPLRKALIESGLGEDLAGEGLGSELRQMTFSTGLKGIDPGKPDRVEGLVLDTLRRLVKKGIDPHAVEAALNTIEFTLRENNTGHFPRGLSIMLRALTTWLHGGDPLALVAFEGPLEDVKSRASRGKAFFEGLLNDHFLSNPHRTTLVLQPDLHLGKREEGVEKERLTRAREAMGQADLERIVATTRHLKEIQETPDPPEALATIPVLNLADLDRRNKPIPSSLLGPEGKGILYHDLFTNGILYLDVGFDLHTLPQRYLPYVRLFGRGLLEMGTEKEDYVTLTQRISRKTGGIVPAFHTSLVKDTERGTAWLLLRGKAMLNQSHELLEIIADVLLQVRLDNRDRFRQMVLESKARQEQKMVPNGHQVIDLRIRSHFNEADWAAEQMAGLSYLFFLRRLSKAVDEDWPGVLADLNEIRKTLINRNAMLVNVTQDETGWLKVHPQVAAFMESLPASSVRRTEWVPEYATPFEGMTIPVKVNYVGKGADLYGLGYRFHGSAHVISRYLRSAWLWERIRLQGGAYGAFCLFDRLSGVLTFVSYRDPNLLKTLDAFDQSAVFLRNLELSRDELSKGIIGAIGDMDKYKLPDAKGYTSMVHYLSGETEEDRQRMRDEILNTGPGDFKVFGQVLETMRDKGLVKVLGPQGSIEEAMEGRPGWLKVVKVL